MTVGLPLGNFESLVSLTLVDANVAELLDGRRWNLLQAVAYVASEDEQLVAEVGRWLPPRNALPHENVAKGVSMTLANHLTSIQDRAMPFGSALLAVFRMLQSGNVLCYVDHSPCFLGDYKFNALRFNDDSVGLSPSPDDRYWGYVVVDVATFRKEWAAQKTTAPSIPNPAMALTGGVLQKLTQAEENAWYQGRVEIAKAAGFRWSRDEDEAAGRRRGVTSATVRELRKTYAPDWGRGSKPTTQEASLKAAFLADPNNLGISN
jgi:hypothetical protein